MIKLLTLILTLASTLMAEPIVSGYTSLIELAKTNNCTIYPIPFNDRDEYVAILEDAHVFENGVIITKEHKVLEDTAVLWNKPIAEHPLLYKDLEAQEIFFDGMLAVIASSGQQNYYHWMFQMLPRLELIKRSGIRYDKLYFYELNQPFHYETLSRLGISPDDIVVGKPNVIIHAKNLLVPSIPVWPSKGKGFAPWVQHFLHNHFLPVVPKKAPWRKIYISRCNASIRRIINEENVIKMLKSKGFEVVHLEELSVEQQAQLFSESRVIVGSHGAGLTNLVFAQQGTHVVEINSPANNRHPYDRLSRERNLTYVLYEPKIDNLTQQQIVEDDIVIDLSDFEAFINNLSLPQPDLINSTEN